jgi:hypothetical protein
MLYRVKQAALALTSRETVAGRGVWIRPDDTFLVSLPKSGNTWVRALVANLLHGRDSEITLTSLATLVPDIYRATNKAMWALPSPRVLKSHEYLDPRYRRVVYIVRDPREVAVSTYYYLQKVEPDWHAPPIDEFIPEFITGRRWPYGSWKEHVGGWVSAREGDTDFLLVRYEDLKHDLLPVLAKIAAFVKAPTDEATLKRAAEQSSVERLRELEKLEGWQPESRAGVRKDVSFFRAAKAASWRQELSPMSVAKIQVHFGELMRRLGYL